MSPAESPPLDVETLRSTRLALHMVAEHLLAGDLADKTGRIGLRALPGGFGQPESLLEGRRHRLRVDGTDLVVLDDDVERWIPLTSLSEAAALAGRALGAPKDTYTAETVLDADGDLNIDSAAAASLAHWFALVGEALEVVRRSYRNRSPSITQLWPEHFDIACTINKVNLGGSPGDPDNDEPYLYVGPWDPRSGDFWNETWGASLNWRQVPDVASAVAFLDHGLRLGTSS